MTSIMEKEINEQGSVISNLITKYIQNGKITFDFPVAFDKVKFIASGSSYNCSCIGEKLFKDIADVEAVVEYSSEFMSNKDQKIDTNTLYFFTSQSGETADTLKVLEIVQKKGGVCFALTNNENSTLSKTADYDLSIEAGEEKSIAATKSFSASVFLTALCALKIAQEKGIDISKYIENIEKLPEKLEKLVVNSQDGIKKAAKFLSGYKNVPIVGYHYYYALAKEGSLKTKETSFIDANPYALGEFIHGHVALLNQDTTIIEIFGDDLGEYELKSLNKIKNNYNPKIIAITDYTGDMQFEHKIAFPKTDSLIEKIISIIYLMQLLALNTAEALGRDVDHPHGLTKVVD